MSGFNKPNYTETPNMLFDDFMKDMSESELKVTLAIVRQTFGYHKKSDPISLSQLEKMTGLSRTACQSGVDAVIKRGLVTRSTGKRNVSIYTLVVNDDQSTKATSTGSELLPVTSSKLLHTKEIEKENSKEITSPNGKVPKSDLNAQYDTISEIWGTTASGTIVSMRGMIFGSTKTRGQWKLCQFEPPASIDELKRFEPYMVTRMKDKNLTDKPTTPVVIQRWFYDFREAQIKASQPKTEKERWAEIPELRGITEIIR